MKVDKNITFALEIQKMPKDEMEKRVKESLKEVQMEGYEDRYPREMSGGQQQRIALARMLAYRPKVFLMDEPLSNLDARLRMDMRTELKRLHHISGATTIYVTHDQVEALTMSTNIAIMKEGVVQQFDTPDKVYHFPANLFVADFIGNPKVNLLDGVVSGKNTVDLGNFKITINTVMQMAMWWLASARKILPYHPSPSRMRWSSAPIPSCPPELTPPSLPAWVMSN